jgi:hypothetical protein
MGKNISIYLNDDALKWLDHLCEEWNMGRSETLQTVLIMWKKMTKSLDALLEQEKLGDDLNKILKSSKRGEIAK